MERNNIMSTTASYGATDSGPHPPAQQRASAESTSKPANANDTILPVVAPSTTNTPSNGHSNGHPNGNSNGNGVSNGNGLGGGKKAMEWMAQSIDSKQASLISVANCFLTGFTSAVAFSACYIW